jgi:hypothetical protein
MQHITIIYHSCQVYFLFNGRMLHYHVATYKLSKILLYRCSHEAMCHLSKQIFNTCNHEAHCKFLLYKIMQKITMQVNTTLSSCSNSIKHLIMHHFLFIIIVCFAAVMFLLQWSATTFSVQHFLVSNFITKIKHNILHQLVLCRCTDVVCCS